MINATRVALQNPFDGIAEVIVRYPGDHALIRLAMEPDQTIRAAALAAYTGFTPEAASRISEVDAVRIYAAARRLNDGRS